LEDIAARVKPIAESAAISLWSYMASAMHQAESGGVGAEKVTSALGEVSVGGISTTAVRELLNIMAW
jgi:hypothetical protein